MSSVKEIILVNFPPGNDHNYENAGCIYPSTGIMLIGTILKNNGFSVHLVDGALDRDYEQKVLEKISDKTSFVGISAMTSQIVRAYRLANKIKVKNKDLPIVCGGIHPTLFPEQTVNNRYIDIAVINEGAKTVLEIIEYFNGRVNLQDIKGIAFCDTEGNVKVTVPRELDDISEIPHFDFDILDISRYLDTTSIYRRELDPLGDKQIKLMPILTGLGCCFRCAFCINVILKRRYRARSAESIVEEIKRLQSNYGANAFLFLDEDFCIDKKRLARFIQLVKDENINFLGRIWTRVSYFRQKPFKDLLPEMEEIGIKSIAMGAESASQRILDYIQKDTKCDDIMYAAKELSKMNITPRFSFMVGMEGERKEDTIATYKLCASLLKMNSKTDIAGPFTFRYYPGSPIFREMVQKHNIQLPKSIQEWGECLNDDGSLIVDFQKWTWPGYLKYSESMRGYINLYVHILNGSKYRNNHIVKISKKMLLWRISHGEYCFGIDYHFFKFLKKIKGVLVRLKYRVKQQSVR
ncbi:cobalamin B12-binding domain-containing protein [Patescibacteria group bacterium]|nr:cobalamin B12-binding domain-containing protein [Patescibacteria group bacterium]